MKLTKEEIKNGMEMITSIIIYGIVIVGGIGIIGKLFHWAINVWRAL